MKKNGFSKIEILVVIIILAVLILIAKPLISMILSSSKKVSLRNTVLEAVKFVDQSYLDKSKEDIKVIEDNIVNDEDVVYELQINNVKYRYYCKSLSSLKNANSDLKDINDDYRGYFQIFDDVDNGKSITYVNISDGKYYIQDKFEDISKDNYKVSDKDKKDNNFSCPKAISLP